MISILFVCLDSEYESQCPLIAIKILRSLTVIPIVNEVKMIIIPLIRELPPNLVRPLILSSLMMAVAFLISMIYSTLKITYSLIMNLFYIILVVLIISVCLGISMNSIPVQQNFQQYFEYIKLLYQ
ncbi:unnamed protein product (macronuclear) [Paramecium tetraurelia]|uniref:ABC-2 type transporter domain-containing protein n=1 Tax=Paramecium tetraurelia TaxID=5888 RepID=A0DIQ0_PARTE|nr:uncharacterized protein GSPATT00017274001 [Paramecium tetraurelia]CAK82917.1 unnamed protein product [Paramecium tetraurelia]|eukprot:XP_001450314.1 hypothetical protein (macronuclear) [Paramecium tetraurelia strain d4-2]